MVEFFDVIWNGDRHDPCRGHLIVAPDVPRVLAEPPATQLPPDTRVKRGQLRGVVLRALAEHGPRSSTALGRLVGRDSAAVTNVLVQLRARRLVTVVSTIPAAAGAKGGRPSLVFGLTAAGVRESQA